jgi:hypothetical protein
MTFLHDVRLHFVVATGAPYRYLCSVIACAESWCTSSMLYPSSRRKKRTSFDLPVPAAPVNANSPKSTSSPRSAEPEEQRLFDFCALYSLL